MEKTYSQSFIEEPSRNSRGDENAKIVVNHDNGDQTTNISLENQREKTSKKSCFQRLKETHIVYKILALLVGITIIFGPIVVLPPIMLKQSAITTQSTQQRPDPIDANIVVLQSNELSYSYLFSGDGLSKSPINIQLTSTYPDQLVPDVDQFGSAFAVVKGEIHIFGGYNNPQMIAKVSEEACEIDHVRQWDFFHIFRYPVELVIEYKNGFAAIAINNGEKALICFENLGQKKCEIFDGARSKSTHLTVFKHFYGSLGHYEGQPTTVGGVEYGKNVNIRSHTLIGLESGAMLMLGGYNIEGFLSNDYEGSTKDIWLLKDKIWTQIGVLNEYCEDGSALKIDDYIYLVSGGIKDSNGLYPVERIKIVNDEVIHTKVIGGHEFRSEAPVIFEASANFCV